MNIEILLIVLLLLGLVVTNMRLSKVLKTSEKSDSVKIPIVFEQEDGPTLNYAITGSAGGDISAFKFLKLYDSNNEILLNGVELDKKRHLTLQPGQRVLVSSGFKVNIPLGYEMQIRSRSGLALKHGIIVANSPGTIDSGYTGTVGVVLVNTSNAPYTIGQYERVAQAVIAKYEIPEFVKIEEHETTERGEKGFGSTGS